MSYIPAQQAKSEDTKGIIGIGKSMKGRQFKRQKKQASSDPENTTQKTKD